MSGENETLIRRYFDEILSKGDFAAADELIDPDVVFHPAEIHGRGNFLQYLGVLRAAFPDLNFTVEDEVSNGEKAAGRFTMRGTHQGEFMGIPASNNAVEIRGVDFFRLENDRIKEIWVSLDSFGLMQQLGAIASQ
jgi:steroid delta-isomerase-like uncharacterized protein